MCQIQFVMNLKGQLDDRDIEEFFRLMAFGSLANSDSFGIFNGSEKWKRQGMFNLKKVDEGELRKGCFVVGHNRLATTGSARNNYNNHPFEYQGFVMVHNGIIQNWEFLQEKCGIDSKVETDSYVMLRVFFHCFGKVFSGKPRRARVVSAIKQMAKELAGSYSVFLLDRVAGELYHFRSSGTLFSFCQLGDEVLVGSTERNNLEYAYTDEQYVPDKNQWGDRKDVKTEDGKIYLLESGVKQIGSFEENEPWSRCVDYGHDEICSFIDQSLMEGVAYCPEYKIKDGDTLIFNDEKELRSWFKYVGIEYVRKDKRLLVDIDDFLSCPHFYT